ncbi:hypothetical protein HDU93_001729, partial [Gonapodya sp. JEL0774]
PPSVAPGSPLLVREALKGSGSGPPSRASPPPPHQVGAAAKETGKPPSAPKSKPPTKPKPPVPKPKTKGHAAYIAAFPELPGPGEPGFDGDYSRVPKPTNQTPTDQFWRFADQYLRNITDEDMKWLGSKGEDRSLYMIPPLGRPYRQQWDEDDRQLRIGAGLPSTTSSIPPPLGPPQQVADLRPHLSNSARDGTPVKEYVESNDTVVDGDVYLGHFSERLMSALLQEGLMPAASGVGSGGAEQPDEGKADDGDRVLKGAGEGRSRADLVSLEERLKWELREIGLIGDDDIDWSTTEDDAVCVQLRSLQRQLQERVQANHARKLRVLEVARRWKGYQEYREVLDQLDRMLEQAYIRRFRSAKKKKTPLQPIRPLPTARPGVPQHDPDNVAEILKKRRKIMKELGERLYPRKEYGGEPKTKSIFADEVGGDDLFEWDNWDEFAHIAKRTAKQLPQASARYLWNLFPIFGWLPHYEPAWIPADILAGFTIGMVVVPQSLAYAKVAQLPPEYGLYSSFVGVIVYSLFATSKDMTIGPTAVMALTVGQVINRVNADQSVANVAIATAFSMIGGLISMCKTCFGPVM